MSIDTSRRKHVERDSAKSVVCMRLGGRCTVIHGNHSIRNKLPWLRVGFLVLIKPRWFVEVCELVCAAVTQLRSA